ncbi:MAG TPA: hypothetical protein VM187_05785, partial [Niastella sp.]|nr:hypothetical protein [Niastella sp.]
TGLMSVKKLLFGLTTGACLLAACKKSKSLHVEEELIGKMKAENITCICDPYLKKYEWTGRTVYLKYMSGPSCNGIPVYYNSTGERLVLPNGTTFDEFLAEATFITELWSCKETRVMSP